MAEEMNILMGKFLSYIEYEKNRSPLTVENYGNDLKAFIEYTNTVETDLSWEDVDQDVVRGWMEYMLDKGNSAASVSRRLSALRTFYRFALANGLVSHDPVRNISSPKKKKSLPVYLREKDMDRLLDDTEWGSDFEEVRNRTIIELFYETGIRLSELVGMDIDSVDFINDQIKVLGKRNKERVIPFGFSLANQLKNYVSERKKVAAESQTALIITVNGERMKPQQVRNVVRRNLLKVSSLKKRSPHVLRHTFATTMLNNDSGLESIQKLLGHKSVSTTEIYTHTTYEQLKKVYGKSHPRGEDSE